MGWAKRICALGDGWSVEGHRMVMKVVDRMKMMERESRTWVKGDDSSRLIDAGHPNLEVAQRLFR